MVYTKEQAKSKISELVRNYVENKDKLKNISETDTRIKFIDRLFEFLGWDVFGEKISDEVQREESVKTKESGKKKADYTFRINGISRFVVEAKALGESLDNSVYIKQAVNYAYNKACSWAVLTNFSKVLIFYVDRKSNTSFYRIDLSDAKSLSSELDTLWFLSKESVSNNLLEIEAKRRGLRIDKISIDQQLLDDMKKWREILSNDIRKRYGNEYESYVIDEIVQRIIDRLIFIRKTEDAKLEEPKLDPIIRRFNDNTYNEIKKVFVEYRENYDSKLFEEDRKSLHESDKIDITNNVIEDVIRGMYKPKDSDIEYDFSAIDSDILGSIYEQYLAYVLSQTEKKVKLKGGISHRKEQGIYYTPVYIVDFIVRNTLGELLKTTKPKDVSKIKVLDPACGSGSFLIKAFDMLNEYYAKNDKNYEQTKLDLVNGTTFSKKVEIIKNNIFGVDLDSKAVEIAQLNLLLKIAEKGHRLPVLQQNIKFGNSLIDDERISDRAFIWKEKFNEIMNEGGFDVIIGNPPWLMAGYYLNKEIDYLHTKYESAKGKFDLYYCFIELGLRLMSKKGVFGMIVPNKFFHTKSATNLREILSKSGKIHTIIDFGDEKVFGDATNYSSIILLRDGESKYIKYLLVDSKLKIKKEITISKDSLKEDPWYFEDEQQSSIFQKMEKNGTPLNQIVFRFGTGAQTGADKIMFLRDNELKNYGSEISLFKRMLRGRDIRRYSLSNETRRVIFPYNVINSTFQIMEENELRKHKRIYSLLESNKNYLSKRRWFGKNATQLSGKWYGFMFLDSYESFNKPHILTPSLSNKSNFTLGENDIFVTGTAGVTSIILDQIPENIRYILGLLNSKLLSFYIISHSPIFQGGYHKFSSNYLKKVPIRRINFNDNSDKLLHDKIISFVDKILFLNKRLNKLGNKETDEKFRIEDEIIQLENEIDKKVYELYELTKEDIRFVEESLKKPIK